MKRRDFLKLAGVGVAYASGCARSAEIVPAECDFWFAHVSDTHIGFKGAPSPEAELLLPRAVEAINAAPTPPAFVVFTGDLTHTVDDPQERRRRMAHFREEVSLLRVPSLRFLPGEHDATLDEGAAFREAFGPTRWSFDHEGVHFIGLDNVSLGAALGKEQLEWIEADLARAPREAPTVVFAHRPLFDLYPAWDWDTTDGARAIELLSRRENVSVFYGHIHQEHTHETGRIVHHAARSLVFPLPPPGGAPKRVPMPYDVRAADHGVGWREAKMRYSMAAPIARTLPT